MQPRKAADIGITSRGNCWTGRPKPEPRAGESRQLPLKSLVVRRIRDWLADAAAIPPGHSTCCLRRRNPKAVNRARQECCRGRDRRSPHIHAFKHRARSSVECLGEVAKQIKAVEKPQSEGNGNVTTCPFPPASSVPARRCGSSSATGRSPQLPTPALCVFSSVPIRSGSSSSQFLKAVVAFAAKMASAEEPFRGPIQLACSHYLPEKGTTGVGYTEY